MVTNDHRNTCSILNSAYSMVLLEQWCTKSHFIKMTRHKCSQWDVDSLKTIPNSKVHGASMGPTWVLWDPDGPHGGPMNLVIRDGQSPLSAKGGNDQGGLTRDQEKRYPPWINIWKPTLLIPMLLWDLLEDQCGLRMGSSYVTRWYCPCTITLKQWVFFFKMLSLFHFLISFPTTLIFLHKSGLIQWIFSEHCGYWWLGALSHPCDSSCL